MIPLLMAAIMVLAGLVVIARLLEDEMYVLALLAFLVTLWALLGILG